VPIRYVNRNLSRQALAGFYATARLGLVTPLRDGMNLVAKEYVAAQDPEDPGVLLLSRFAGAAEQLGGALLVNPYDIGGVADAIGTALRMEPGERRERHAESLRSLHEQDIHWWTSTFLKALASRTRDAGTSTPTALQED
jgi:trehalose 6-phosphate synthase